MNDIQRREMVKQAYPSKKWSFKVDHMTEDQVVAIYLRLKKTGIIR